MTLFTAAELGDWLHKPVTAEAAAVAERVVWGWLKPILGATTRPEPVPDELFSWALELGAIATENPAGLSSRDLGPFKEAFSAERRKAILAEVADSALAGYGASRPRGKFPKPCPYPDPARP